MRKFKSEADLREWLVRRTREEAVPIAARATLRVLRAGIAAMDAARETLEVKQRFALALFRAMAILRVTDDKRAIRSTAIAAAGAIRSARTAARASALPARSATANAAEYACAALYDEEATPASVSAVVSAINAAEDVARHTDRSIVTDLSVVWLAVSDDADFLEKNNGDSRRLLAEPLWFRRAPVWLGSGRTERWPWMARDGASWDHWIAWCDRVASGTSLAWGLDWSGEVEMARRLAEADDAFWGMGKAFSDPKRRDVATVNRDIADWLAELAAEKNSRQLRTDFFVSYTTKDEAIAREVIEVLREVGFSVVSMLDFGGNWVGDINREIKSARRIIAIYSKAYFRSEHCMAEWNYSYNRDPSGRRHVLRAFMWEPCSPKLPALGQQILYRTLVDKSRTERAETIREWATYKLKRKTRKQAAEFASEVVSPMPIRSSVDTVDAVPNPIFDRPASLQDLAAPIDLIIRLLEAILKSLDGNSFLRLLHNDLKGYHDEIEERRGNASWAWLDLLKTSAELVFNATDRREFDAGLAFKIGQLFVLHAQCQTALANADLRSIGLAEIGIDQSAPPGAILRPVRELKAAIDLLNDHRLAEERLTQNVDHLTRMAQEFAAPPLTGGDSGSLERGGPKNRSDQLKALAISALGTARETLKVVEALASVPDWVIEQANEHLHSSIVGLEALIR